MCTMIKLAIGRLVNKGMSELRCLGFPCSVGAEEQHGAACQEVDKHGRFYVKISYL